MAGLSVNTNSSDLALLYRLNGINTQTYATTTTRYNADQGYSVAGNPNRPVHRNAESAEYLGVPAVALKCDLLA